VLAVAEYGKIELICKGMPRILLSAAHIMSLILESLGFKYSQPLLSASFPPLPQPFHATAERIESLQSTDTAAIAEAYRVRCEESAKKPFCDHGRIISKL
jgi:hypothetical protein